MLPAAIGGTGGQRPRHLRLLPGGAAPARPRPRPCRLPARLLILGPSFPGHRERGASLPALPGRPAVPGGRRAGGGKRFQDRGQTGSSKPCCLPTGDINTVWEGKKLKNNKTTRRWAVLPRKSQPSILVGDIPQTSAVRNCTKCQVVL